MIVILPYHGHFSRNSEDNLIPSKVKKKQDRDKENDRDKKKRNRAKPKTLLKSGSFASYGKGAGWLILKKNTGSILLPKMHADKHSKNVTFSKPNKRHIRQHKIHITHLRKNSQCIRGLTKYKCLHVFYSCILSNPPPACLLFVNDVPVFY